MRVIVFRKDAIGDVAEVAGDEAKLIERVGVAAIVVLRFDTGVGLPFELKVWRIGLARSSDAELKSSLVGVDGKVGDSGSANALCGTSPGLIKKVEKHKKVGTRTGPNRRFFFQACACGGFTLKCSAMT